MTIDKLTRLLRDRLNALYNDRREAEAVVRLIFRYIKGWRQVDILIHGNEEASCFVESEINKIMERLGKGEPIQYITGEAYFAGLDFKVNGDVLIPRPETAELTDLIIDENKSKDDLNVLDVGTGSGCIAIVLGRNLPFSHVKAIDISVKALAIARENAQILKVKNVEFEEADIFDWTAPEDSLNIIVSNPPYILESEKVDMERRVKDFEPAHALFVTEDDPLVFYRRIGTIGRRSLRQDGKLYFEINPRCSVELRMMLESQGYRSVEIIRDSYGRERFAKATNK